MAFLARARKVDLLTLIKELDLIAPANPKVYDLAELVTGSENYDEEFTKNLLSSIASEREENLEREKSEREFQLRKLELEATARQNNDSRNNSKKNDLIKLMTRYDTNGGDISIYLSLFERQISRTEIGREDWVTYLLGLLPLEIVNLIAREPDPLANDYDHIKKLLLKRFKLSPEQFRQNFVSHKKEASASWRDFAYELNNFFEEWIAGLEVSNYEDLKELMVADQLKRKISPEMREHFVDDLPKIKKVDELVNMLDEYEAVRIHLRRSSNRDVKVLDDKNKKNAMKDFNKSHSFVRAHSNAANQNLKCFNCNEVGHKSANCENKQSGIRCFKCKCYGHKANICTQKEVNRAVINNSYISQRKIHKNIEIQGKETNAIIDTGSDVTMISWQFYTLIGSPTLNSDNASLMGITGEKISPLGYFATEILIDKCTVLSNIYVLKNLSNDVVIGIDVINKLNISLTENGIEVLGKRDNLQVNYARLIYEKQDVQRPSQKHERCTGANALKPPEKNVKKRDIPALSVPPFGEKGETQLKRNPNRENVYLFAPSSNEFETNLQETNCRETTDTFLVLVADAVHIDEINLSHISNVKHREKAMKLIKSYEPHRIKNTEVKMKNKERRIRRRT